jgi:hypothetical protein
MNGGVAELNVYHAFWDLYRGALIPAGFWITGWFGSGISLHCIDSFLFYPLLA